MNGSGKKKIGSNKVNDVTTFTVPFSLQEIIDNLAKDTSTKDSVDEIIKKAFQFHSVGNLSEAIKYYQYCISKEFNDPRIYSNYGNILRDLGYLVEAESSLRKAIKLRPDFAEAYSNLGNILRDIGKFEEAESSLRKAIEIRPDFAEAYSNLGNILRDIGEFKEAVLSHEKAIELKPFSALAYFNLSICLYILGDKYSAFKMIKKAYDLDSEDKSISLLFNIFSGPKAKLVKENDLERIRKLFASDESKGVPMNLYRKIEPELIDILYKIKARDALSKDKYQPVIIGNSKGSDFFLFNNDNSVIKNLKEDIVELLTKTFQSEIFIQDSFLTIFNSGGGVRRHNHLTKLDKINCLDLSFQKYSLVYYISKGDQDCTEPGILKLYDPDIEILPYDGLIIIFPADREHSAFYTGKKDRIVVGVNFYLI